MAVKLIGSAGAPAPLVDQINRFTGEFVNVSGSVLGTVGQFDAQLLRQLQNDTIGFHVQLPAHWQTMHLDIGWANQTVAAGSATFRADFYPHAAGDNLSAAFADTGATVSVAAGAQFVAVNSRIRSDAVCAPSKRLFVRVLRIASPADGLASNVGVYRATLTRAT